MVMRRKMPDAPRAFRTPLVPLVPILGIAVCLFMMVFLPPDTWIRLIVWMLMGFDMYLFYGMRNSLLNQGNFNNKSFRTVSFVGVGMAILLAAVAVLHHHTTESTDESLYKFSMGFAVLHVILFIFTSTKKGKQAE